jgi:hypothetical protein
VHPHWRVEWRRDEPYTLAELADWIFEWDCGPTRAPRPRSVLAATSRCFDELRHIAYREVLAFKRDGSLEIWLARCERLAISLN